MTLLLDVAIGLTLLYLALALVVTTIQELLASVFATRAKRLYDALADIVTGDVDDGEGGTKPLVQALIEVTTIEWPGGAPRKLTIDVPAAVLRNVARDAQATLALPFDMSVGEAASLPLGTQALLKADSKAISVLLGPALFDTRGAHLRILAANPSPSETAETLRKHAS